MKCKDFVPVYTDTNYAFKYCTECKTVVFYKVLSVLMLDHQVFGIRQMHIILIYRQLEAITQDRNQVP